MKYKCSVCNEEVQCESMKDIVSNKKMCSKHLFEDRKKVRDENMKNKGTIFKCGICDKEYTSYLKDDGNPFKATCSDECKRIRRNMLNNNKEHPLQCETCGNTFIGLKAKYCSIECRSKGSENTHFKKGLKRANMAISMQKNEDSIKVYGANKDKGKKYINDKTRKDIS